MYGERVEVNEEGGGNYFDPGVYKVRIKSLTLTNLATANYTGEVADLVVVDDAGREMNERIFPYAFSQNFKDLVTKELLPEKEQERIWATKYKALFMVTLGGSDAYDATVAPATSFATWVGALAPKVVEGHSFWQVFHADKNNYTKLLMHKGGTTRTFIEGKACPIVFDEAKYGKKQPAGVVENAPTESKSDFFDN